MYHPESIFILIRSLANGGAEKQSILLSKALQQKFPTYLIVLDKTPLHEKHLRKIDKEEIRVIFLEGNLWQKFLLFCKLIRKHRAEYLFSFLPSDTFLSALAGRVCGVRKIYGGVRNAYIPWKKRVVLKFLHNHLLDHTISNCHTGVERLSVQGFQKDKFLVIHNAFESEDNKYRSTDDQSTVNIITVGRFVDQKNYPFALRLFKKLISSPHLPNLRYTIVGYGEREFQIRELIQELDLNDYVDVVINPDHVSILLQEADIYLSTSYFEGLSNAIMEGMSQGLPVVASPAGDNAYLVRDEVNGFIHELSNEQGFFKSLEALILNSDMRNSFGRNSAEIIKKDFSYEAFQQKYFRLIEDSYQRAHEKI